MLREARLLSAMPVLSEIDDIENVHRLLGPLCMHHLGPVAITASGEQVPRLDLRPMVQLHVPLPSLGDRATLWQRCAAQLTPEQALALAGCYSIPGGVIERAVQAALPEPDGTLSEKALRRAVHAQLHDQLTRLGRQLPTEASFEDLVVDEHVAATLWEIVHRMRHRQKVRSDWGLRGAAGVAVLFSGSPGVGKSMSAQVIARELGLLLYEIDLSCVMSKWLGETEKNLAEIFDAAEAGHAILLFNEADSLFGKRTSDVRNANDRYANLETNYLLQRLERFSGLAILTTNQTDALDAAFRRRFAYDVQFSFPGEDLREQLWRRALPRGQAGAVDPRQVAKRFELSGGFIKVATERAAFVASSLGAPLSTKLLLEVIERLYMERGKLAAIGRLE